MQTRTHELMSFFQHHGGVARFSVILRAGFHPDLLSALEKDGKVEKIARGLYRVTNYTPGSHPDLVIASLQAPNGVICLLSAGSLIEPEPRRLTVHGPSRGQRLRGVEIKYPPVK